MAIVRGGNGGSSIPPYIAANVRIGNRQNSGKIEEGLACHDGGREVLRVWELHVGP